MKIIIQKALPRIRSVQYFICEISLRASCPIWVSEVSLARTRERGAENSPFLCPSRLRRSLSRSPETRFTRPKKLFTQFYKALYGDAIFMSLSGAQIWPPEANRNICF